MEFQSQHTHLDLPCEIWECVAQFLTDDQLQQMYSVNRTFYRVAMGLRYHQITIGNIYGPGGFETFNCLISSAFHCHVPFDSGNPELVQHVQSLRLKSTPVGDILADTFAKTRMGMVRSRHKRGASLADFFRRSTQRRGEVEKGHISTAEKLRGFVNALKRLTKLTIEWDASWGGPDLFDGPAELLVTIGWQAYSSNIRELELNISVEICERVVLPSLRLDRLETLILRLEKFYTNTDDTEIIRKTLVPFVLGHINTLKALTFKSFQNLDMTTFFQNIGHIPNLKRLHIQQPYLGVGYTHSNSFLLHLYVDTLVDFSWDFYEAPDPRFNYTPAEVWFAQPPYHVKFLNLRHLALGLRGFPLREYFDEIASYIETHHDTLVTLKLTGWAFDMNQFHKLVERIASPSLVELELSVDVLCSAVILDLAENFSCLQVLHLSYNEVGRQVWVPDLQAYRPAEPPSDADPVPHTGATLQVKISQFVEDVSVLCLPCWRLSALSLAGGTRYLRLTTARVGSLLLKGLPRVGFINGLYREDFLELEA
ncbi:hypothetical protein P691DRAFT_809245 [Macrolepiota fuliginosa MF-IS2]|uniref:F-box domain-containing protein n=1 Tax=Macrolepiota fuliginosa MF-IS2 TaxID=1400762 RepID=A0A9P5XJH5_9AGAR|nr:hypothetical protein P691DRAFT_809245 [Macrolepiota fuliginosa MF-IS2]